MSDRPKQGKELSEQVVELMKVFGEFIPTSKQEEVGQLPLPKGRGLWLC